MKALVICTRNEKCIPVLFESIDQYVKDDIVVYVSGSNLKLRTKRTINFENTGKSFGEAYNTAIKIAFQEHDEIVISNDDIVLNPNSWELMSQDVAAIKNHIRENIGWIAARSNVVRESQNICSKRVIDDTIVERLLVAPIFAYIHKNSWIDFPEINWFSDDVQCYDMRQKGLRHFVSRCYVHHVGSQNIGTNYNKLREDSIEWMKLNRPDVMDIVIKLSETYDD